MNLNIIKELIIFEIWFVKLVSLSKTNKLYIYLFWIDGFIHESHWLSWKIKDVVDISIVKNNLNSKYQIIKSDNTTDNISCRCCINIPSKDRDLKNAMRYAIFPQK